MPEGEPSNQKDFSSLLITWLGSLASSSARLTVLSTTEFLLGGRIRRSFFGGSVAFLASIAAARLRACWFLMAFSCWVATWATVGRVPAALVVGTVVAVPGSRTMNGAEIVWLLLRIDSLMKSLGSTMTAIRA